MIPPELPAEAARQSGGLTTADGRPIQLAESQTSLRSLLDVLKPNEVVTARVIERFVDDTYLFTLRGRNLIAASSTPLARDSVAQFQVIGKGDQITLRMLGAAPPSPAITSQPEQRLQALNLPASPAAMAVLTTFENLEAPLTADRLRAALTQVQQAASPADGQSLARAHALLAKANLPATPALLGVALSAIQGQLPQAGQATHQLATQLAPHLPATTSTPFLASPAHGATASALTPPGSLPTPPINPAALPAAGVPIPQATGSPVPPPPASSGIPPTTATPPPSNAIPHQVSNNLLQAFVDLDLLPAERSAMERVLLANGLRPQPESSSTPHTAPEAPPSPLNAEPSPRHVVQELLHLIKQLGPELNAHSPNHLTSLAREHLAEALLPPQAMMDYDLVIPLSLPMTPQPPPARLAVAHRTSSGGEEVVYMRVDVELSQLGPLSIRLSSLTGGPLAITILATGAAIQALEEEHPDLEKDLLAHVADVSIRIGDLLDDGARP